MREIEILSGKNLHQKADFSRINYRDLERQTKEPARLTHPVHKERPKDHMQWFTAHDAPGRVQAAVMAHNRFQLLIADLDKGNASLEHIQAVVAECEFPSWLAYTTVSSRPGDQRWRVVVPLDQPIDHYLWTAHQLHLAKLLGGGDLRQAQPYQLAFLPYTTKDTEQYYQRLVVDGGDLYDATVGDFMQAAMEDYDRRLEDESKRARQAEREAHHEPLCDGQLSVIHAYNAEHDLEDLLIGYDYAPAANGRYVAPSSKTGRAGVVLFDDTDRLRVYSHHSDDQLANGHANDAFDVFRIMEHAGDRDAALKAAGAELKTPAGISITDHNRQVMRVQREREKAEKEGRQNAVASLEDMQERYAVCVSGKRVFRIDQDSGRYSDPIDLDEFKFEFAHLKHPVPVGDKVKLVEMTKAWTESPDTIRLKGSRFAPDRADEKVVTINGSRYANSYIPIAHEVPDKVSEPEVFLKHVKYLLPNEDEREYFLNWLAMLVQRPGVRMPMCLMVANGVYGLGRSMLGDIITDVVGYAKPITFDEFAGRGSQAQYNDWKAESLLVIMNEVLQVDRSYGAKADAYEAVKNSIDTRIQRDERIKPKYGVITIQDLFYNLLAFTNHVDAMMLPRDDRRVTVLENPMERKDDEYFIGLYERMRVEIPEIWRHLKNRHLGDFRHAQPLATEMKDRMTEGAQSLPEQILEGMRRHAKGELITAEQWRTLARVLVSRSSVPLQRQAEVEGIVMGHFRTLPTLYPKGQKNEIRMGKKGKVYPRIFPAERQTAIRTRLTKSENLKWAKKELRKNELIQVVIDNESAKIEFEKQ